MTLIKAERPSILEATVYKPVICLILQGAKRIVTDRMEFSFGAGEFLIVSHQIPVVTQITDASSVKPYMALIVELDLSLIRSLYEQVGGLALPRSESEALTVTAAGPKLVDSLYRLMAATQDDIERRVLLPQFLREVHLRLLLEPGGGMLRGLLHIDSHATQVTKAIDIIRSRYVDAISVPFIASEVGMSTSSLHKHFKEVTHCTPLQYQKELRLLEARRLIRTEGFGVTAAAYGVGYESASQFSREYTRKFNVNPSNDCR